ncbi:MAG: response regulator [Chitinophagaceae bacterium]
MRKPFFLLADDDEDDRFFFSQAVAAIDAAIECIMVSNGKEVLTILQNDIFSLPDYIFLDLNMPVMNGLQCLEAIKKDPHYSTTHVIIYSTTINEQTEGDLIKAGAFASFVKPSGTAALAHILRQLCGL